MSKKNKALFVFIVVGTFLLVGVLDSVQKINDGLYIGKKGDLYFALERVNDKNIHFWNQYAHEQEQVSDRVETEKKRREWDRAMSIASFGRSLEYATNDHVWVAYASIKPIKKSAQAIPLEVSGDIEMVVTVMTNEELPFTTHLGIFRAVEFAQEKSKKHKGLSMDLHSFAAKAAMQHYDNKYYMITKPMKIMRDILLKKLSKKYVSLGEHNEIAIALKDKKLLDTYQKVVSLYNKNPKAVDWSGFSSALAELSTIGLGSPEKQAYVIDLAEKYIANNKKYIMQQFNVLFPTGELHDISPLIITEDKRMTIVTPLGKKVTVKMPDFYNSIDLFEVEDFLTIIIDLKYLAGLLKLDK